MAHLWCRSLVQGRPHMDVGLTRRAGLVVVRCGGCRWSGQRHYKKHCRSLREASITLKKLLLVVLACAIWGRQWADSMVVVHCDNEGAVAAVHAGYSKVPPIMHLLRCLFFIRARYRVALRAVHIPGRCNILADAISRNNLGMLFARRPDVRGGWYPISQEWWHLLVVERPDGTVQQVCLAMQGGGMPGIRTWTLTRTV